MKREQFRDAGKWLADRLPLATPALKWLYSTLPSCFHDHPADFLERYFSQKNHVGFIQIGAHDGVVGDHVRPNVLCDNAWSGVFIEPNPLLFERLKTNYANDSRLRFECVAVSDKPGVMPFYVFNPRGLDCPSWWTEISALGKDHLTRNLPEEFHDHIETIYVQAVTIKDVVDRMPNTVNLIAMDVEGHEVPILRDILRTDIRPDVLMFEHKHIGDEELTEIVEAFWRLGYRTKVYGRDTILYRPDPPVKSLTPR